MGNPVFIVAVVLLVLLVIAGFAWFRSLIEERARAAEARAAKLEDLLEEVKDVAWSNRELAPDFATIIIDTIRTNEEVARRRQLPVSSLPPMANDTAGRSVRGILVLFVLALVVGLFCLVFVRPSTASTGPDQVSLHYKGGAFTSKRFSDCIAPSNRVFDGPGDGHYAYPASQSNFVFDTGEGDGGPITFVTKDGIEMTVEGVANFVLNTDCSTQDLGGRTYPGGALQQFHELIGNRYAAYMTEDGFRSDGWRQMLSIYIARPLDTAIDRAGQAYTYAELYTDPVKKAAWETSVREQLPGLVDRQTDGDTSFFLNFAITLQKPEPPQSIKDELVKQQAAVAAAKAAQAEAEAREAAALAQVEVEKAEAKKIQARIDVLGIQGYLQQYAIDNGQNPFQPSTNSLINGGQP